jgi:GNAT superfamily N-acetyltransferase
MHDPTPVWRTIATFAGDHVVGIACLDRPGACSFCTLEPDRKHHADHAAEVLYGVSLAIKELHTGLPAHANIGPVAVEPTLQRQGIGRRLVEAAFALAVTTDPATVSLDCDPRLVGFYGSVGFRPVATTTDPYGFDIVAMRCDP